MSLNTALGRLEAVDSSKIDFGLKRISAVLRNMGLSQSTAKVVTVAGTNGKGSTCKLIHDIVTAAGYRCGLYSSPHLIRLNERLVINGDMIVDDELEAALNAVEAGRGDIHLSYFEQLTVAALWWFRRCDVDVMVLEVGLGGRLDAVNAVDADVAVVTNISLDHADWLGTDIQQIGREKAAVARRAKPLLLGNAQMPASVAALGEELGAVVLKLGVDFQPLQSTGLPPTLHPDNAAVAVAACGEIPNLVIASEHQQAVLQSWTMAGRCQLLATETGETVLDVAHNRDSAQQLAEFLRKRRPLGSCVAVFGIYADKEVDEVISAVSGLFQHWYAAPLDSGRSLDKHGLAAALDNQDNVSLYASITEAYIAAEERVAPDDQIVVFGSFEAVGPVLDLIQCR